MMEYIKQYLVPILFFLAVGVVGEWVYTAFFDGNKNLILISELYDLSTDKLIESNTYIVIKNTHYETNATQGFNNIFTKYWDLLAIFILTIVTCIAIVMPISIYFLKVLFNQKLSDARTCERDASNHINQAKVECINKISNAYDAQREIVLNELSERDEMISSRESSLLNRENTIKNKELIAENTEKIARERIEMYDAHHEELKLEFEKREKFLIKNRDTTFAALNRIKKKHGIPIKNTIPQDPYDI